MTITSRARAAAMDLIHAVTPRRGSGWLALTGLVECPHCDCKVQSMHHVLRGEALGIAYECVRCGATHLLYDRWASVS